MPWLCRPRGRTGRTSGSWWGGPGVRLYEARRSESRPGAVRRGELCFSIPRFCLFQLNRSDRAPSCLSTEGVFFQLHKEAVKPCCSRNLSPAQLTERCASQELTSFLSIFQPFFIDAVNYIEAIPFQFTVVGCEHATELSPSYVANFKYLLHKIIS